MQQGNSVELRLLPRKLNLPHISTVRSSARMLALEPNSVSRLRSTWTRGIACAGFRDQRDGRRPFGTAGYRERFLPRRIPRTLEQVGKLDVILVGLGTPLDKVGEITANTEEVIARLANRAKLEGRADDTEEVFVGEWRLCGADRATDCCLS